jgi:hypothetical protein
MVAINDTKPHKVMFPGFWIDAELYTAFRSKAQREGVPMAEVLRQAIDAYLVRNPREEDDNG